MSLKRKGMLSWVLPSTLICLHCQSIRSLIITVLFGILMLSGMWSHELEWWNSVLCLLFVLFFKHRNGHKMFSSCELIFFSPLLPSCFLLLSFSHVLLCSTGVCVSGTSHGENVCLQEVGKEEDKEEERRVHGTQWEADFGESQQQICSKHLILSVCYLLFFH